LDLKECKQGTIQSFELQADFHDMTRLWWKVAACAKLSCLARSTGKIYGSLIIKIFRLGILKIVLHQILALFIES